MDFDELADDFVAITRSVAYCTMTTVDAAGRPRSRIMHPVFEVVDGHPRGWAVTDRTRVKSRHLATNPHVACFYWSPAQDTVAVDCVATWVTDDDLRGRVWDLFATPPPIGWGDMAGYLPEGIHHPTFHVLRLRPWRVQIILAEQLGTGDLTPRTWSDGRVGSE